MGRVTTRLALAALALAAGCTADNEDAGGGGAGADPDASASVDGGAGGEGGAGGAGGAPNDAAAGDAGADAGPVPDADASLPEDPCAAPCARFVGCAVDLCDGFEDPDRGTLEGLCQAACGANASFPVVVGGIETCEDLVAYGRQAVAGDFAQRCPAGPPVVRQHPECAVFGRRIAECLVDACAPVGDHVDLFSAVTADFCDQAIAQGATNPEQIAQLVGPNTPCDHPYLAQVVREQYVDSPENANDGYLAGFCANGPYTPLETCREACRVVGACIEPGSENDVLRNPDRCAHLCLAASNPPAYGWACTAELEPNQCAQFGACFAPPAVPACEPYAARLAACTAATCEAVAPVAAGLTGQLVNYCNGEVAAGRLTAELIADVAPDTDCADPRLATPVAALTAPPAQGAEGGPLGAICREGLPRDPSLCTGACENVGPCIPENDDSAALRDLETCRWFCATTVEVPDALWQCLDRADGGCAQVGTCF